jgi:RsiW-degrading membrane proteinase PrsW (M82 family)
MKENAMDLDTQLKRVLYGSPVHRTGGKIALAAILIGMFVYALPAFYKYYLTQPAQMLAGLAVTAVLYFPTILVLLFLDRREREAKVLFWGAALAVIFFFGPVASRTNNLLRASTGLADWQFAGFVEETIKALPLVLLLIFARPAVNGARDGLIFGALGGLGFAMLEGAAYFAFLDYPNTGWSALLPGTIGRATLLGTDIHILFAATVGAAVGYGVSTKKRWLGILVMIGGFLLVALTHGQQDHTVGKTLAIVGAVISNSIVAFIAGLPFEQADQLQGTPLSYLALLISSTIAMIGINLFNLIILFVAVWRSGDTERRVVQDQMKSEPATVITLKEYAGVEAERRLHLRMLLGYPKERSKRIRALQNELAFRKDYVQRHGGNLVTDPPISALRQLIGIERTNAVSSGKAV